jgi:hypothetical protein
MSSFMVLPARINRDLGTFSISLVPNVGDIYLPFIITLHLFLFLLKAYCFFFLISTNAHLRNLEHVISNYNSNKKTIKQLMFLYSDPNRYNERRT